MSEGAAVAPKGLQDIVAGSTAISKVDSAGVLLYRGYDIGDLARNARYEEVAFLLLRGHLPGQAELAEFSGSLAAERTLSPLVARLVAELASKGKPMDVLRTAVSAMGSEDSEEADNSAQAEQRKSLRLTAKVPTVIAAYIRQRAGKKAIAPDPKLGHAEDFVRMTFGDRAHPDAARIFNVAFILNGDHGFNASTFTARVVASTTADLHAAITAAIGALKGPLHGGATDGTMRQLQEIGSPERAEEWLRRESQQKGFRIMGFGHRAYRVFDPRAEHFRGFARELAARTGQRSLVDLQERLVELAPAYIRHEGYRFPNVDFYAATTYHLLGLNADLGTSIFAVGRIAGWCAHVLEQHADNRIIRPESDYVGPEGLAWVPLERR